MSAVCYVSAEDYGRHFEKHAGDVIRRDASHELFITSGGRGYVFDLRTKVPVGQLAGFFVDLDHRLGVPDRRLAQHDRRWESCRGRRRYLGPHDRRVT